MAMLLCTLLHATKSVPNIVKFKQPDGTVVLFKVSGDEVFGYKQTLQGDVVEIGEDGYLYYAEITLSGKRITKNRVVQGAGGGLGSPSKFVLSQIRALNRDNFPPDKYTPVFAFTKSGANALRYLVIPVQFSDVKFSIPDARGRINSMLNTAGYSADGAAGSVADYFKDNFSGAVTFKFDVADVVTLDNPLATYGVSSNLKNDVNVKQMVLDACSKVYEQGVDFSLYDNNMDGIADNVALIYAGYSEAEGGGEGSIWPHQATILQDNVEYSGVKIGSYSCSAELKGAQGKQFASIGTFCHEFIHSFGVPDFYDVNGEEEGEGKALYGSLSIMDRGNFSDSGNTPPFLTSIEREIMGISANIVDIVPDKNYKLPPVYKSENLYRINTLTEGEYFFIESRGSGKWDAHIGGGGMVVYHIDKSNKNVAGLPAVKRWEYNNVNCFAPHECARVIPAVSADGVEGVFYPGLSGVKELLSTSADYPLKDWMGYALGVGLKNISYSEGDVCFKSIADYSFSDTLPKVMDLRCMPYQNDARIEWMQAEEDAQMGHKWVVRYKNLDKGVEMSEVVDTTMCFLENLIPGSNFRVEVSSLVGMEYGEPVKSEFKTMPVTSVYPGIFIKQNGYKVAERVDLRVFNVLEAVKNVNWYINDNKIDSDWCTFKESGVQEIKLEIIYKDGSKEYIYKKIIVK